MYKLIEAPDMFSSHILAIDDIGKVLSQTIPNNHSVIITGYYMGYTLIWVLSTSDTYHITNE